jgi:hypothetical protein
MNLQPLTGPAFRFACIRCGIPCAHPKPISHAAPAVADLDGIPFRAYYCGACAAIRRAERMVAAGRGEITLGAIVEVRNA